MAASRISSRDPLPPSFRSFSIRASYRAYWAGENLRFRPTGTSAARTDGDEDRDEEDGDEDRDEEDEDEDEDEDDVEEEEEEEVEDREEEEEDEDGDEGKDEAGAGEPYPLATGLGI
jgi:hypothetical protein